MPFCTTTRTVSFIAAVLFLTACQTDSTPPMQPAPKPVIQPSGNQTIGKSSEITKTEVLSDGTVKTTKKSASLSVDSGALVNALFGGAAASANTAEDYAGVWKLQQADGKTCSVTLRTQQFGNFRSMSPMGCFSETMFGTSKWNLVGNEVVFYDTMGARVAGLRATGANRLEGSGMVMFR